MLEITMFFTIFIGLVLFLAILFCCEKDDDRKNEEIYLERIIQQKIMADLLVECKV